MMDLDLWSVLWVIINLLVLFLLLKKFLFGRVLNIIDKRQKMIEDDLKDAADQKAQAEALKAKYEDTIKGAHAEAVSIMDSAKANANRQSDEILAEAREEGARIVRDAQKTIETERTKMLDDAKFEIADLALVAAAKVMNKKLDSEDDKKLAESFISEVGDSK